MQRFFELLSERERDRYMTTERYGRGAKPRDYRNGYYKRDFVTRLGTLRLSIARTRKKNFLPEVIGKFQRRAEEVCLLIREAFLRGISTRQVGLIVAIIEIWTRRSNSSFRRGWKMSGRICFWMESACGYAGRWVASGYKC
jgi:transposase-like protein